MLGSAPWNVPTLFILLDAVQGFINDSVENHIDGSLSYARGCGPLAVLVILRSNRVFTMQ